MYYTWSWWWLVTWLVPMAILLWFIFGWNGGRYTYARRAELWDRDERLRRELRRGSLRGRGPRGYRRPDARIYEDVCDRLMLDDDLDASDVEVRVDAGKITLTGSVATRQERRIAESVAEGTPGAIDVDNGLRVDQAAMNPQPQADPSLPGTPN